MHNLILLHQDPHLIGLARDLNESSIPGRIYSSRNTNSKWSQDKPRIPWSSSKHTSNNRCLNEVTRTVDLRRCTVMFKLWLAGKPWIQHGKGPQLINLTRAISTKVIYFFTKSHRKSPDYLVLTSDQTKRQRKFLDEKLGFDPRNTNWDTSSN